MPDTFDNIRAGKRLEQLLAEHDYNQAQFAQAAKVDAAWVGRIINHGQISLKSGLGPQYRMAQVVGMSLAEFRRYLGYPEDQIFEDMGEDRSAGANPILQHLKQIEAKLDGITQRLDLALSSADPGADPDRSAHERAAAEVQRQFDRELEEVDPEVRGLVLASLASKYLPGSNTPEGRG